MNPVRHLKGKKMIKRKKKPARHPGMSNGMKVLLVADVEKVGWLGDAVEVSEGYARNYLLPCGLAVEVTEANLRAIAEEKKGRAEQRMAEKALLEEVAKRVDGAEAVIAAKANEQGHLFGSVMARDIAANLREQGFEVADEVVQLAEHIKRVGSLQVELRFAEDLTATVSIVVVAEGVDTTSLKGPEQENENEPNGQEK